MSHGDQAGERSSSHTLISNQPETIIRPVDSVREIESKLTGLNKRPRPLEGLDIYEDSSVFEFFENKYRDSQIRQKDLINPKQKVHERKNFVSANKIKQMAFESYMRAKRVFGHLDVFKKYSSRPQFLHHTVEVISRYAKLFNTKLPVLWFVPEVIQVMDLVGLGISPGWWQRDPNFAHIPTVDPYGDAKRSADSLDDARNCNGERGGYWVLWQPRLLPFSSFATKEQQLWLMSQLAHELGLPNQEVCLGDLSEQAVLWAQASAEGMVNIKNFWSVRTQTVLRSVLLHEDYLRATNISCCLGTNGTSLEVMDYGDQAKISRLGISPIII